MEADQYYAGKQFHLAVHTLATGPGKIKERLMEASTYLVMVQPKHLPSDIREDFARLMRILTKNPPKIMTCSRQGKLVSESTGSLGATIPYMRKATARRAAGAICNIEARLRTP